MTKYDGWGRIGLMTNIPIEEINNPRPIFLQAVKEGKSQLAHFCKERGIGVCGKANIPHYGSIGGGSTDDYWKATYLDLEDKAVICVECKKEFLKTFNEDGSLINEEINTEAEINE